MLEQASTRGISQLLQQTGVLCNQQPAIIIQVFTNFNEVWHTVVNTELLVETARQSNRLVNAYACFDCFLIVSLSFEAINFKQSFAMFVTYPNTGCSRADFVFLLFNWLRVNYLRDCMHFIRILREDRSQYSTNGLQE